MSESATRLPLEVAPHQLAHSSRPVIRDAETTQQKRRQTHIPHSAHKDRAKVPRFGLFYVDADSETSATQKYAFGPHAVTIESLRFGRQNAGLGGTARAIFGRLTPWKARDTMPETKPRKSFAAKHLPPGFAHFPRLFFKIDKFSRSISQPDRTIKPHAFAPA
jgi:hypothetical protein